MINDVLTTKTGFLSSSRIGNFWTWHPRAALMQINNTSRLSRHEHWNSSTLSRNLFLPLYGHWPAFMLTTWKRPCELCHSSIFRHSAAYWFICRISHCEGYVDRSWLRNDRHTSRPSWPEKVAIKQTIVIFWYTTIQAKKATIAELHSVEHYRFILRRALRLRRFQVMRLCGEPKKRFWICTLLT